MSASRRDVDSTREASVPSSATFKSPPLMKISRANAVKNAVIADMPSPSPSTGHGCVKNQRSALRVSVSRVGTATRFDEADPTIVAAAITEQTFRSSKVGSASRYHWISAERVAEGSCIRVTDRT